MIKFGYKFVVGKRGWETKMQFSYTYKHFCFIMNMPMNVFDALPSTMDWLRRQTFSVGDMRLDDSTLVMNYMDEQTMHLDLLRVNPWVIEERSPYYGHYLNMYHPDDAVPNYADGVKKFSEVAKFFDKLENGTLLEKIMAHRSKLAQNMVFKNPTMLSGDDFVSIDFKDVIFLEDLIRGHKETNSAIH